MDIDQEVVTTLVVVILSLYQLINADNIYKGIMEVIGSNWLWSRLVGYTSDEG